MNGLPIPPRHLAARLLLLGGLLVSMAPPAMSAEKSLYYRCVALGSTQLAYSAVGNIAFRNGRIDGEAVRKNFMADAPTLERGIVMCHGHDTQARLDDELASLKKNWPKLRPVALPVAPRW